MRTALAYGLAWPERVDSGVAPLDLAALARFDFEAPDLAAFPCLGLAFDALEAGGSAPAILNAANEIAVSAFLQGRLGFLGIPDLIRACLDALPGGPAGDLAQLMDTDAAARRTAEALVPRMRA
jgi:1-deoxy-D-xylulose-5-phosphate reductoisomerase